MSMMEIGPVRMSMHDSLVAMAVRVRSRGSRRLASRMLVRVVSIIVPMRVLVLERLVLVQVRMALRGEESDAGDEEKPRDQVHEAEGLAEHEGEESDTEEGSSPAKATCARVAPSTCAEEM